MQHYEFPEIKTIDDVKPFIAGVDGINVNDREAYDVVDYAYVSPETFPVINENTGADDEHIAKIRRECRGLLFNKDGSLLSRRLHKFFNMGEREETMPENIDFTKPHTILDKEDGSMVSPFMDPAEHIHWAFETSMGYTQRVFWGTMFGWTDVGNAAAEFVRASNFDYDGLARACISDGWTPVFEWCSPKSRVVLHHNQQKMVLLQIRHNISGVYKTRREVEEIAEQFGVPIVKAFGSVTEDPRQFMNRVHEETDIEGYVVMFDSGHAVKLKTSWYLRFHKAKENLVWEKDVWSLILSGDTDDVMPVLMEQDRDRLVEYQKSFWGAINATANAMADRVQCMVEECGGDQKAFAGMVNSDAEIPKNAKWMAFRIKTGDDPFEVAKSFASKHVISASAVEKARDVLGVPNWDTFSK